MHVPVTTGRPGVCWGFDSSILQTTADATKDKHSGGTLSPSGAEYPSKNDQDPRSELKRYSLKYTGRRSDRRGRTRYISGQRRWHTEWNRMKSQDLQGKGGLSSTEKHLEIQCSFPVKQDQDFQYKCQGCTSLRSRDMVGHSDNHKEDTECCQQLSKKNPWCLVTWNHQWWTVVATYMADLVKQEIHWRRWIRLAFTELEKRPKMPHSTALFALNLMQCQRRLQISVVKNIRNVFKLNSVAFHVALPYGGLLVLYC